MFDPIGYDDLKLAAEACEMSEKKEGLEWAEDEGIDYEGMMKFCAEDATSALTSSPEIARMVLTDPPRAALALTMLGMVMGIRYANLIHNVRKDA